VTYNCHMQTRRYSVSLSRTTTTTEVNALHAVIVTLLIIPIDRVLRYANTTVELQLRLRSCS